MALPKITPYPMPDADRLPAGPLRWELDPARAVLLVHDMQRHFLSAFDTGAAPVPELIANVSRLREACAAAEVPVVFSAQPGEQSLGQRGLLQDLWGNGVGGGDAAAIIPELAPVPGERHLTKWRYSAFVRTELLDELRAQGRDQLLICGIYAHIGCLMTAVHAFMEDVQPFLVGDAVADFSPQDHHMALDYAARRCARVLGTQEAVDELVPALGSPWVDRVRGELAPLLELPVDELADDEDLLMLGLDSIRVMTLVTDWRREGLEVAFEDLVEAPTIAGWAQLLERCSAAVPARA